MRGIYPYTAGHRVANYALSIRLQHFVFNRHREPLLKRNKQQNL